MRNRKLLPRLRNKLAGLPILLLAACQSNIVYHSYEPVSPDGWAKSDTLVYTLPASVPAGNYEMEIGVRYQVSYPYKDIWLGISNNMQDTLTYATDTLHFFLFDDSGNKTGNSPGGLYQCELPYKASFPIHVEGNGRTFRIAHIMADQPLKGISDVGIRLRRTAN